MKKTILASALLVCGIFSQAQDNAVTKHFSAWQNDARFTKVTVSPAMFELFENLDAETPEEKELLDAIKNIKGMSILSCDDCGAPKEMYNTAISGVSKRFEELMLIQDGNVNVDILIRENAGIVQELLFVVAEEKSFVVIDVWGEVDLKQVMKFTKTMASADLPDIAPEKLLAAKKVKIYPNPVQTNQDLTLEVEPEMVGKDCVIHDLQGKERKRMRIDRSTMRIPVQGLSSGQYVLSIWDNTGKITSHSISVL